MKKHILTLLIGAIITIPTITQATTPQFAHLETVGIGEVTTKPDIADIDVSVSINRKNAQDAKKATDEAIVNLLVRLEKMGIAKSDIDSANLSLRPQYSYPKDQEPKLTGYMATRNIKITVRNLNSLNNILDGALSDGLNQVNNISFSSSNEEQLKEQARMASIEDAKAKAASLAKGFGVTISGVWQISYKDNSLNRPMLRQFSAQVNNVNASYDDAQITIRDSVGVIFSLAK